MKQFLRSPSGKGTIAVYLAGLLLSWPPALSWLVAFILGVFAIRQFWESFHELDDATAVAEQGYGQPLATLAAATGGDCPLCDVTAATAALTASPTDTPRNRSK
jgi:hypothetical protein